MNASKQIVKTFEGVNFSIVKEGSDIWLWGKAVADVLGYVDPDGAIRDHVEDEDRRKTKKLICNNSGSAQNRLCWQINECGLYSLAFSSKLPMAKKFKRWVFAVVLPSIRKTGQYQKPTIKHNQLSIISEKDLHYEVVKEIKKRFSHLVLVAQMGELQDTSNKRTDAWNRGYIGGQPDLLIVNPHRCYNGFCIEFKNPGGTGVLSEKQKGVLEVYDHMGWKTLVCDDLVEGVLEISKYNEDVMVLCVVCGNSFKTEKTLERHMKRFHNEQNFICA